jgi:hypothetical protein
MSIKDFFVWLTGALAFLTTFGVYQKHKGRQEAAAESNEQALKGVQDAKKISDDVDSMSADDIAASMRKRARNK